MIYYNHSEGLTTLKKGENIMREFKTKKVVVSGVGYVRFYGVWENGKLLNYVTTKPCRVPEDYLLIGWRKTKYNPQRASMRVISMLLETPLE